MQYLPAETLLEIVSYVRPQRNLDALFCVAKWLSKSLCKLLQQNQWSETRLGSFAGTHLLTPFQKTALLDLVQNRHTSVPDVDNGHILMRALLGYLCKHLDSQIDVTCIGVPSFKVGGNHLVDKEKQLLTRSYNDELYLHQRAAYAKTEVVFSAQSVPYKEDGVTRYTILLSDCVHPVDEYTPLWTFGSNLTLTASIPPFLKETDASKSVLVNLDTPFEDIKSITVNNQLSYQDIAQYDTFFCGHGKELTRLYSLLMQFSTTPKRVICCYNSKFQEPCGPVVSKHRYQYTLDVFGGEEKNLVHCRCATRGMSYAEVCAMTVGYAYLNAKNSYNWVINNIGNENKLTCNEFLRLKKYDNCGWFCTNPGARLTEICEFEPLYPIKIEKLAIKPYVVPMNKNQTKNDLLEIVKYSMTCKSGRKGSGSLTLEEARQHCRKRKLYVTGTRAQLLERLLGFLQK